MSVTHRQSDVQGLEDKLTNAEELAYLPATEVVTAFRRRALSPVELMHAVVRRAEAVEPVVNAFAHRFTEEALQTAQSAEARYMGKGDPPRRLEGLPVAVKEETPVAGKPWTEGSLTREHVVADFNAPAVERVLQGGGIVHGMSTAPEFSCVAWTNSRLHGPTRNPWNAQYSPGGSSGGAAASLASGTSALALGSDIGGSIRIPAGYCGVVGYKPPFGRVPSYPPFNLDYYTHEGPLARSVEDCLLLEDVIAGPHPLDVASIPYSRASDLPASDVQGWKIAVCPRLGDFLVDDDGANNVLAAAEVLRQAGAVVEEVDLGWSRHDIARAAGEHFKSLFVPYIMNVDADERDQMCQYALQYPEWLRGDLDLMGAMELEGRLYRRLADVFADYRLLVCSTNGCIGFPAEQESLLDLPAVNGAKPEGLFAVTPTVVFNMFSRCPVMSVPSGYARNGLPTGIQIAGSPFDEAGVFAAALAYQRLHPWLHTALHRPRL